MTLEEVRSLINENNEAIKNSMFEKGFILNPNMTELLNKRDEIRKNCTHEFENGKCKWCDLPEEEEA